MDFHFLTTFFFFHCTFVVLICHSFLTKKKIGASNYFSATSLTFERILCFVVVVSSKTER